MARFASSVVDPVELVNSLCLQGRAVYPPPRLPQPLALRTLAALQQVDLAGRRRRHGSGQRAAGVRRIGDAPLGFPPLQILAIAGRRAIVDQELADVEADAPGANDRHDWPDRLGARDRLGA